MKNFGLFILFIWGLLISNPTFAQTLEKASISFKQFDELRTSGAEDSLICKAYCQCLTDYVAVISNAEPNTSAYQQAKKVVEGLLPFCMKAFPHYSKNDKTLALKLAQAYNDVLLSNAFATDSAMRNDKRSAIMAQHAAIGTYNAKDYEKAINYIKLSIDLTDNTQNQENLYGILIQSYMNVEDYESAVIALDEVTPQYPSNYKFLSMAINSCIKLNDTQKLKHYLDLALAIKPNDERLLEVQKTLIFDVDYNIPEVDIVNENTYAVIIANENYSMVSKVPYALKDGEKFAEYCTKILGIPERNVIHTSDASFGTMVSIMEKVKQLSVARRGDMKVILYYAGHGVPDATGREVYLLPIDSNGKQFRACYSLRDLYRELEELNVNSVMVFMDACFSGAKRDGGMVVEGRGVAIKPKRVTPRGNMVVFSAASGDETALPYKEKEHGMFTYFLLKKIKETKGDVTLKDLSDYVTSKVSLESVQVNDKLQNPTISISSALNDSWQSIKLNE